MEDLVKAAHRSHSGMVVGDLRIVVHKHLVELHDVGLAFAKRVARAVAADHDILRLCLTRSVRDCPSQPMRRCPTPRSL